MTKTLAAKVAEGLSSQNWRIIGRGGTWAGALRPLEQYIQRKVEKAVKAERERCLRLIDEHVRAVDAEDVVRAIKEGNT